MEAGWVVVATAVGLAATGLSAGDAARDDQAEVGDGIDDALLGLALLVVQLHVVTPPSTTACRARSITTAETTR